MTVGSRRRFGQACWPHCSSGLRRLRAPGFGCRCWSCTGPPPTCTSPAPVGGDREGSHREEREGIHRTGPHRPRAPPCQSVPGRVDLGATTPKLTTPPRTCAAARARRQPTGCHRRAQPERRCGSGRRRPRRGLPLHPSRHAVVQDPAAADHVGVRHRLDLDLVRRENLDLVSRERAGGERG
ncbi:unnamed protein product [Urochloa humidicola]